MSVAKAARPRCKNLGTEDFAKTAMQAIQRHISPNRMFLGRLENTDLRTCANCKQLTARHLQKHQVPRFLHRGYIGRKPGIPCYGRPGNTAGLTSRPTWQYSRFSNSGRTSNPAGRLGGTTDLEIRHTWQKSRLASTAIWH